MAAFLTWWITSFLKNLVWLSNEKVSRIEYNRLCNNIPTPKWRIELKGYDKDYIQSESNG